MPQRNTLQRQLVLQAVQALHHHPTAEDIYTHIARQHPHISRGTVYRNLGHLCHTGQVRRVSHLNAADRFDFQLAPHYHFICSGCGGVFDVDLPYQEDLLQNIQNPGGFLYEGYEITVTGRCPTCCGHTNTDTQYN